jgi:hypothetical protein
MNKRVAVLRSDAERLRKAAEELESDAATARQTAAERLSLADDYERIIGRATSAVDERMSE